VESVLAAYLRKARKYGRESLVKRQREYDINAKLHAENKFLHDRELKTRALLHEKMEESAAAVRRMDGMSADIAGLTKAVQLLVANQNPAVVNVMTRAQRAQREVNREQGQIFTDEEEDLLHVHLERTTMKCSNLRPRAADRERCGTARPAQRTQRPRGASLDRTPRRCSRRRWRR
jgi:hypothetical protein